MSKFLHNAARTWALIRPIHCLLLCCLYAADCPGQQNTGDQTTPSAAEDMLWMANDAVRVGLKKSSGGAIAWIGDAKMARNLINSFDRGRLVQQSWYGREDGSLWNKKPWRWNPVQGGDWKGQSAAILEQRHGESQSFIQTQPVHWASGATLTDCVMEQTITLKDRLIHVHYDFSYSGQESHPACHQELPAFFVDASFQTLVRYEGSAPWTDAPLTRSEPAWPNEYKPMTEHWAAYVDNQGYGIGCFVPIASELTCYRFGKNGKGPDACSYFAPIRTLAVTPGFHWEYDAWITIGTVDDIRSRFRQVAKEM